MVRYGYCVEVGKGFKFCGYYNCDVCDFRKFLKYSRGLGVFLIYVKVGKKWYSWRRGKGWY